ncbi:MAG TPA: tetratricopeptide repeat protein [Stellaceae bacterium]|nr:tetratricopeptide repeat protein [Stellaceae bacterium]
MNITSEANEQRRTNFAALRWDAAWIDPAVRRMAETAARQSGLTVEAWMERAIRRVCGMPAALDLARAAEQPTAPAAKGFSAMLSGARAETKAEEAPAPAPAEPRSETAAPRLFAETEREPMAFRERIDTPPNKTRRSRPAPPERGGSRVISMVGAAGIAAVLAIVAVALIREGGSPPANHEVANSDASSEQTVSTLPPVSALDSAPMRVSQNATDHSATFAAVPPPIEPAANDQGQDQDQADATPAKTDDPATESAAAAPAAPSSAPANTQPVQMAALPAQTQTTATTAPPAEEAQKPTVTPPTPERAATTATTAPAAPAAPAATQAAALPPQTPPTVAPPTQIATAATAAPPPMPAPPANSAQTQSDIKIAASLVPLVKEGDHVAEYRLGILYALGKGVPHDYNQAATLLHRSAESGLPEAEYDYGVLCDKGLGVPRDSAEAARWYGKAAQQGHPPAALNLGYAYAEGLGVTRNLPEAAHWFHRAAEAGLVNAQFNLAYMYEQGAGVSKSTVDAYAWYTIAAEKDDQGAQEALQRIEAKMSVRELTAAKARVRTIKRNIRVLN